MDIDPANYGEYVLRVETSAVGGKKYASETLFTAGKREVRMLADKGQSEYRIVLGADASESEKWAAEELQHWLEEATGAALPIDELSPGADPASPVISIGS